jgi:hypothetical protein
MKVNPIRKPLSGEQVIGVTPEMALRVEADWQRRMHLYTGRTLSHTALETEQAERAGRLALRGQMLSPGVVNGLEVTLERPAVPGGPETPLAGYYWHVHAGLGLKNSGEDVVVPRTLRVSVGDVPVYTQASLLGGAGTGGGSTPSGRVLYARQLGPPLTQFLGEVEIPATFPRAGVLVLRPVVVETVGEFDPTDPCEQDQSSFAFEDWQLIDGCQLVLYTWPSEWQPLPEASGGRWQNRMAYSIFEAERTLPAGEYLPWEDVGVPIALAGFDTDWTPLFVDRYAVVRDGGKYRQASVLRTATGSPFLWQARLRQFVEQIAEATERQVPLANLPDAFRYLPPIGILPTETIPPRTRVNRFFPSSYHIDAVPVPTEQLDIVVEASAAMQPFDTFTADQVRILVPVPQVWYEPRLLVTEVVAPAFQTAIDGFVAMRARALDRRANVRRKSAALLRAVQGSAPTFPPDANLLEPESGAEPFVATGAHRSALVSGMHQHFFTGATQPFPVEAEATLFAYVYLDPDTPPSEVMLQWFDGTWEHRAYWGADSINFGTNNTESRHPMGPLPPTGRWLRLDVPANVVGLAGGALNGMAFTLFGGRAAWARAGRSSVPGQDITWFENALPAGATPHGDAEGWDWITALDVLAPFEDAYGTEVVGEVTRATALEALKNRLPAVLATEAERSRIDGEGLERYIAALDERINRADDTIDLGFLRVQTDIYRVRQLVLDTTTATRLAVSPALAGIAQAESAPATQEQLATFYERLRSQQTGRPPVGLTAAAPVAETPASPFLRIEPTTPIIQRPGMLPADILAERPAQLAQLQDLLLAESTARLLPGIAAAALPSDVQEQGPIIGRPIIRTTSIAERLIEPKAPEAKNFSVASRHNVIGGLVGLDISLDGLQVPDRRTGSPTVDAVDLNAFKDPERLGQILQDPDPATTDEAAYFTASVEQLDQTIAALRVVEGRIQVYKQARLLCQETLTQLRALIRQAELRLHAIEDDLAEARHDVAVARALLAEEETRINSINQRRTTILDEQVDFLVFYRPRAVDTLRNTPVRAINPGLMEATVPACLAHDIAIPPELRSMVDLLRDIPVKHFTALPPLLTRLDHLEIVQAVVVGAKERAQTVRASVPMVRSSGMLGEAISKVFTAQQQVVAQYRTQVAQLDLSAVREQSWSRSVDLVFEALSPGDLIDGRHGRIDLAQRTARELDDMAHVAACLYRAFGEVLPAIRLEWAERLSQYDAPVNLRNLAGLPRWSALDFVDRRDMQILADWLFQRVDARQPQAVALINDLVRMCILLASHAPVHQIIAGYLPKPETVRPGSRVLLTADLAKLRVGMHVLMYAGSSVAARAVVEDLTSGSVAARVTQTHAPTVQLEANARVQFVEPEHPILSTVSTLQAADISFKLL